MLLPLGENGGSGAGNQTHANDDDDSDGDDSNGDDSEDGGDGDDGVDDDGKDSPKVPKVLFVGETNSFCDEIIEHERHFKDGWVLLLYMYYM